jgi:hypothetical protein
MGNNGDKNCVEAQKHGEWEHLSSLFVNFDAASLANQLSTTIMREPKDGHAYLPSEIAKLRRILKIDESVWSDERLYSNTDKLAALVGFYFLFERKAAAADRIKEISARLIRPSETLLHALNDSGEFSKEFTQSNGLHEIERGSLVKALQQLRRGARKQIAAIKSTSAKGKSWDSDMKERFVFLVAAFRRYVDPSFKPTIKSLSGAVHLLAKPLFNPDPKRHHLFFDGAIRKYVDMRRANRTL